MLSFGSKGGLGNVVPIRATELSVDVPLGVDATVEASLITERDGKEVAIQQSFSVPKGTVHIGDHLVHRTSNNVFVVRSETTDGFRIQSIQDGTFHTASFKLIKQSCWLLAEST